MDDIWWYATSAMCRYGEDAVRCFGTRGFERRVWERHFILIEENDTAKSSSNYSWGIDASQKMGGAEREHLFLQILNDFDNIRGKVPSSMFTVGVDILLPAELENLFACFKVEAGAWSIAEFLLQACCIVRCFNCAQFGQASKHAKLRKSIQGRCWYECTSLWWQDRADACSKTVLVAHKMWCLHQCINMSCH